MRDRFTRVVALTAVLVASSVGCGAEHDPFVLPEDEAEQYDAGGEYVVVASNADIRVDTGGRYIGDSAGTEVAELRYDQGS